jgi:two-component system, OmpR family, sensor histidine kinase MprB
MLRTRFTVAVAAAVAAATLVITAVAFFVIRADLEGQLRQELAGQAASVERIVRHYDGYLPAGWVPPHSNRFAAASPYMQVVTSGGAIWAPTGDQGLLATSADAEQVAAGHRGAYFTDTTVGGVRAATLTTQIEPGLALQLAVPLGTVDADVASVGATLAVLSVAGVGLAALVGWAVARAGLAPVGRLAAVAERVTATGDPGSRVEGDVSGRPDELGRLATSFNTMLGALQRSLAAQRQLVSDASHELRTPLTSMRVNVELLAAHPDLPADERQEVLDRVVAQGAELGQLMVGLTELARGEVQPSEFRDVKLHEVVAADLAAVRRDWPAISFAEELEPCVAFGSAERMGSAIRNLLDNAAKFSPPGKPVEVRLLAGELSVRDYGPGIEPADLPHVFDRFYRAPSARCVPGSGLGLSIVRQVAESHGGSIRVEAPSDGGTRMRLSFPAELCLPAGLCLPTEL